YLVGVSCASRRFCTAVGTFRDSVGQEVVLAEHWNGARWSIRSVPNPPAATSSALEGISCSSTSACIAVGDFVASDGIHVTLEGWCFSCRPERGLAAFVPSDPQLKLEGYEPRSISPPAGYVRHDRELLRAVGRA